MNRWFRTGTLLVLVLLAWPVSAALRPGPQRLSEPPPGLAAPLAFVPWADVLAGRWPPPLLDRLRRALDGERGLLLVGRTDPVGPRGLNRSLGLQYAFEAARGLEGVLGVSPWRLGFASDGEDATEPPGVLVYPWSPSPPPSDPGARVSVLAPTAGLPGGGRFWALWDPHPDVVLWGWDGVEGARLWELDMRGVPLSLPFPGRSRRVALGALYGREPPGTVWRELEGEGPDEALVVGVDAVESWSARLAVDVPPGYTDAVVWGAGIPYRPARGPEGRAVLSVALLPEASSVYVQAVDPRGRIATGPAVPLPEGSGDPPDLLAVLVWDGKEVDLDLHAWSGLFHTRPQDPDPLFSSTAVPGTRLLFDGNAQTRASALAVWGAGGLAVEALCYADLNGVGTEALLFVLEHPSDPLNGRYRLLGPRRLSANPFETRWVAFGGPAPENGKVR